jgi:hypothetical protein
MCKGLCDGVGMIGNNICEKLGDDLLIGNEHSKKISPDVEFPNTGYGANTFDVSDEDKLEIVLNDPKFGMFSLMKYHVLRGYRNDELKKSNTVFCTHIFSLYAALPILIFIAQWLMYVALITNEYYSFDGEWCPNKSTWYEKAMMCGIALIYFTRSFNIWDNLTKRTRGVKVYPCLDAFVMIDTFQEFIFNLFVYGANIWIIFVDGDIQNMILNSMAMEFLMQLDNDFEEYYFKLLPHAAIDLYDNVFITSLENRKLIIDKQQNSCSFRCLRCITYIPFKLLIISLMIFPIICFIMIFYGTLCK